MSTDTRPTKSNPPPQQSQRQAQTRPMAPYEAPESGGPLPDLDEGPAPQPVDDIQAALVAAAQQGASTEIDFDALPEPMPDLDEGPLPGPVDDIQAAITAAAQQGAPADVDFDALPEPASSAPQKVIRFNPKSQPKTAVMPLAAADTSPLPPQQEPEVTASVISPRSTDFWLLLALFITFRLLTLLLLRPGGFIRDWSDFDTYLGIVGLSDYGLYPFTHFWLEWPPLIPWLMVGAYKVSLLLPPWPGDPRLWFIMILGTVFVLFEAGNFVLIDHLARRLCPSPQTVSRVLWLYTGLFPPVYAMLGFFDGVSLFFILLALNFLLADRRLPSAVSVAVGVGVKIIPVLMLPVALRRIWQQHRANRREAGIELGLYGVVFGLALVILLAPFLITGPEWMLASARSMLSRSSWETVWAVADGYYGFGVVAGNRLNSAETNFAAYQAGQLKWWVWPLVTLIFAAIYAFIFTRPADYSPPRNVIAFGGLTVAIFMLYSKGYSPQFLVYLLPFIILLFPDGRGLTYALIFTGLNVLEQPIYFVLLPRAAWLLTFIVIARFIMLWVALLEFVLVIWPKKQPWLLTLRRYLPVALGGLFAAALLALTPLLLRAYAADRLLQSDKPPIETFVGFMQAQAQRGAAGDCPVGEDALRLLVSDQAAYRQIYPYLRQNFKLRLVTGAPEGSHVPPIADLLPDSGVAWILPVGPGGSLLSTEAAKQGHLLDSYNFEGLGAAALYDFPRQHNGAACPSPANFSGGIELVTYRIEPEPRAVNVTLFWRSRSPQKQNLTVFTQLLNTASQRVAGHDSVPHNGAAPVAAWPVNVVQIDSHRIELPPNLPAGDYTLILGFYNDAGARLAAFSSNGASYPNRAAPLQVIKLP